MSQNLEGALDISRANLSFLEGVRGYLGIADHYWSRTKSFVMRRGETPPEKGYLTASIEGIKDRGGRFMKNISIFIAQRRNDEAMARLRFLLVMTNDLESRGKSDGS